MKKKIVGILICVFFIGISIPQTGLFETVKADPGDVILSFNSPGQYPFGLAWDGQHLWNTNYDLTEKGMIYKLDPSDGSITTSFNSPISGNVPTGLTWDGTYLWCAESYFEQEQKGIIYKLDPSDGSIIIRALSQNLIMFLYLQIYGWDAKMRVYNWKKNNKVKEKEFETLLREAVRIIYDSQKPWKEKQYGRRPYPPRSMVLICLLKVYFRMPYRDIESLIRSNKTFKEILQLEKIPDHNTIQRAMAKMPMDYLQNLNQRLTMSFKKRSMTLPLMQQVSV